MRILWYVQQLLDNNDECNDNYYDSNDDNDNTCGFLWYEVALVMANDDSTANILDLIVSINLIIINDNNNNKKNDNNNK